MLFIIKQKREERDIDLNDLATQTGISMEYLKDIEENNIKNVDMDKIEKIAKVLNVKPKELYYTKEEFSALRKQLEDYIEEYGLNDDRTIKLSKLIDEIHML